MFVLDTDHLIIAQWDSQPEAGRLRDRMSQHDESDFYLTVVSTHEQLLGAHNAIQAAKSRDAMARAYRLIESAMIYYNEFKVLPFDDPAIVRFDELRKQGGRIGTMDLRICVDRFVPRFHAPDSKHRGFRESAGAAFRRLDD